MRFSNESIKNFLKPRILFIPIFILYIIFAFFTVAIPQVSPIDLTPIIQGIYALKKMLLFPVYPTMTLGLLGAPISLILIWIYVAAASFVWNHLSSNFVFYGCITMFVVIPILVQSYFTIQLHAPYQIDSTGRVIIPTQVTDFYNSISESDVISRSIQHCTYKNRSMFVVSYSTGFSGSEIVFSTKGNRLSRSWVDDTGRWGTTWALDSHEASCTTLR